MGKEMTPKEKAAELIERFKKHDYDWIAQGNMHTVKLNALIVAEEMIKENEAIIEIVRPYSEKACWPIAERVRDLIIMKQEIETI